MLTLVVGRPGAGKSRYVRERLGCGIAYDLDALAAALRLAAPHEEDHGPSRSVANALLPTFLEQARRFAGEAFVVRCAPTLDELQRIMPDRIVVCTRQYVEPAYPFDLRMYATRICDVMTYAEAHGIELLLVPDGAGAA